MSDDPSPSTPATARIAPTEHDALPAGTRFGEFEIIRVLGVGGFGIVYLAHDHSLDRQVALKEYMPASLATRGDGPMITIRSNSAAATYAIGLRSFINEARLLARFDHPSLVKVYRVWEDNGTAYMVMPYLQGRTLRDARRALGQAPDEAWIRAVLAPVLDALELLHREGVFHRDIAPDNILLPPDALPILLDFGAARRVVGDHAQSLTAILKPSYAPIEQYAEVTAMRQGPWTDLYALGAVLHYLLFGVPPAPAAARAVQPDAEAIAQRVVPGVSPRFMSVVAWMLGVRPLERPQSVAALRAALNGEAPIPAPGQHDATPPRAAAPLPGAAAPVDPAPVTFAPTHVDAAGESTPTGLPAPAERAASKPADTAADTPAAMIAAAPGARAAAPARAPGAAPMRSTPPGTLPPAWVPPRPPRPVPVTDTAAAPIEVRRPARRGPMIAGVLAAMALAGGVLWQFVGVINGQRVVAPPIASTSVAANTVTVAATGARTGPTAVQAANAPASGTNPSAVATPPERPRAAAARVPRSAAPNRSARVAAARPASAREACGDRRFIALAICIDRECERPRFRAGAECVRVLEVKRRRAER